MLLRLITLLIVTTAVISDDDHLQEMRLGAERAEKLTVQEIRKVMIEDEPYSEDYDIKIIISPHAELHNIVEWKLTLHDMEGEFLSYSIEGDGSNPSTQEEFIFRGTLVESDSLILEAKNATDRVAMAYVVIDIKDLPINMAWVGDEDISPSTSVRLSVDEPFEEILVNEGVCSPSESPCYFIRPDPIPQHVEKCIEMPIAETGNNIKLCDDRVIPYRKLIPDPKIKVDENKAYLEMEFTFTGQKFDIEVVAYNPDDHSVVFSDKGYQCRFAVGKYWDQGEKMPCRHFLTLPEDQERIMVLVTRIINGTVTDSNLQLIDESLSSMLTVEEISKVTIEEEDQETENHNIKVIIAPHIPLDDVSEWRLMFNTISGKLVTYVTEGDGSNPSLQTTFIFAGKLVEANAVSVLAMRNGEMIAGSYDVIDIKDVYSSVAWVGRDMTDDYASVRVTTDERIGDIQVDAETCRVEDSPCYYIMPKFKQEYIERCEHITIGTTTRHIKLCNERVTQYKAMSPEPTITLHADKVEVEVEYDRENYTYEVVMFNHEEGGMLLEDTDHRCKFLMGQEREIGDKVSCFYKFPKLLKHDDDHDDHDDENDDDFEDELAILVMKIDHETGDVHESYLHKFGDDADDDDDDLGKNGIVIGIVVGTIIGVALIAGIILFLLKRGAKPESASNRESSARYSAAATSEKAEA